MLPRHVFTQTTHSIASHVAAGPSFGRLTLRCQGAGEGQSRRARSGAHALDPSIETTHDRFAAYGCYPVTVAVTPQLKLPTQIVGLLQIAPVLASHSALPPLAADYCERLTE